MAQRRRDRQGFAHTLGRLGLAGSHLPMAALVAIACAAGGAGMLWRGSGEGMVVERAQSGSEVPRDTAGPTPAEGDGQAGGESGGTSDGQDKQVQNQRFLVHVDGAVGAPGVVELTGSDLRVFDAVTKAGGLAEGADTSAINLAEPLTDGAKIHIPREGEAESAPAAATAAGQAQTSGATGGGQGATLININTATVEELQALTGVGEATAAAIVKDREQNGPFASPEDLMRVSGIGEKKFAKVQGDICV